MRVYRSPTREAIVRLLIDGVPRSVPEIAEELGKHVKSIESCIRDTRNKFGVGLNGFVIAQWYLYRGKGGRASPMYLNGNGERFDLKRPKFDANANRQRYRDKMRAVIRSRNVARKGKELNPWLQILGKGERL